MTMMMMDNNELIVASVARLLHWWNRVAGIGVVLPVKGGRGMSVYPHDLNNIM